MLSSCGDKKDDKTKDGKMDTVSASLVKKDSLTGKEKVSLRYVVRKGDKFAYKLVAKTSNMEKSPATEDKEVKQENEINYFYTKEVTDVDGAGIITYKTQFDSITISAKMDTQSVHYNSNINDSMKLNPAFFQYNAVIKEQFYMRVSPQGEITDVYGLEKIYENLFKALGDTLKEEEKNTIKESFGKESIKEIMQQEYQICPKEEIMQDSSWVKSFTTGVLVFEVVNNAKYTFKGLEQKDGQTLANVEAMLNVEFKNKEAKERGMTLKLENSETSGSGRITMNLTRGCVSRKETSTNLRLHIRLSAGSQSAKSEQGVSTNLIVTLLN
jgi:hypothetical protein